jgi:hypothetical protein
VRRRLIPLLVVPLLLGAIIAYPIGYQQGSGGLSAQVSTSVKLTVIYYDANATSADLYKVLMQGYSPDCWVGCHGITYTLDPTVHLMNGGLDFIGCKTHGAAQSVACQGKDNASYVSVSASGGYTPLFTDTSCHATVAVTNGFTIAKVTGANYTAGTPSAGSVMDQLSYKWVGKTGATSSLDLACIQTEASGGAHVVLYAAGQIGTTTVNIGDSLQTVWQITYSSS